MEDNRNEVILNLEKQFYITTQINILAYSCYWDYISTVELSDASNNPNEIFNNRKIQLKSLGSSEWLDILADLRFYYVNTYNKYSNSEISNVEWK